MALDIIEQLKKSGKIPKFGRRDYNSSAYLHVIVKALRIAFSDGNWWIADPNVKKVLVKKLLSPKYLAKRAKLFDPNKASDPPKYGSPV